MDQLAEEDTYGHLRLQMLMVTLSDNGAVAAPTLTGTGHSPHQMVWEMTTSAIVTDCILLRKDTMGMVHGIIYGMGKDVAQSAVAANGTTHLTSVNTSTIPHLRTWKLDSSHLIIKLPLCLS